MFFVYFKDVESATTFESMETAQTTKPFTIGLHKYNIILNNQFIFYKLHFLAYLFVYF
jgi:hypothetical protein